MKIQRISAIGLALVASTTFMTACGGNTVSSAELERTMQSRLNETHATPSEVTGVDCPEDVPAESGAKTTCTVTTKDHGSKDYEVTIESVDGTDVKYDAQPKN